MSSHKETASAVMPRIELRGITKIDPAVVASKDVSLTALPGEIHAVLGENGAGKSTLMKIIYGVVKPDAGEVRWEGKPVTVANPAHARELGIGMVFQHFSLFETLTVVDNVALALPGKPDLGELAKRITEVSERYGLPVDPRRLAHSLWIGEPRLILAGLNRESPDPFGTDLKDMHLTVHSGEIVGIAGVSGNGQQELLAAISGEEPLSEKHPIMICGTEAGRLGPAARRGL